MLTVHQTRAERQQGSPLDTDGHGGEDGKHALDGCGLRSGFEFRRVRCSVWETDGAGAFSSDMLAWRRHRQCVLGPGVHTRCFRVEPKLESTGVSRDTLWYRMSYHLTGKSLMLQFHFFPPLW